MRRDDRVYVRHMLDTCLGEAASRVSPSFRESHAEIPWVAVIGMRHRIVHDYLEVDYDIVWDVVSLHLPPLVEQLRLAAN